MKLVLERFGHGLESTLSKLFIFSTVPVIGCFGLEDEGRITKVMGETRIPAGTYDLKLRTVGGFHEKYKKRFPDIHKGMLWLKNVPGFEYILIHVGNSEADTAGCILVGEVPVILANGEFEILRSTDAYKRIYPVIAKEIEAGNDVTITVTNREPKNGG